MGTKKKSDEPVFTEQKIQRILTGFISESATKYRMDGLYVFNWESDKLIITKSGYTYEFEVKISRSDFKADFKHKKEKHIILRSCLTGEKYTPKGYEFMEANHYTNMADFEKSTAFSKHYLTSYYKRPNYFYYAVPQDMISVDEVPEYAGLIYVNEYGHATTVKKAPLLHKEKYTDEQLGLCEKFYYNMLNSKRTAENWERNYDEAQAKLKEELKAKGQEITYADMQYKMEQSEFWRDHYEKESARKEKDIMVNRIERRLLIKKIREYEPTFDPTEIENQAIKTARW